MPGLLLQVLAAQRLDEARDLAGERRLDARQRAPAMIASSRRLVGKLDIGVEAAPAQRVGQLARAVLVRITYGIEVARDRAELGDADLEVGQELQQVGLELLVGAVDLVDQQDRRARPG